jgi:hypothetical protein
MVPRAGRALFVGSVMMCLAFAFGCGAKASVGQSNLTTSSGGREVRASLDGAGSMTSGANATVITFAGGKHTVEKAAVKLDGEELAKLPEDAEKVEVNCTAGMLTVTAEGKSVVSKELRM